MTIIDDDRLLTLAEAGRYFSMSDKLFTRLFIETGKLIHQRFEVKGEKKIREVVRVRMGDLKKLIDEHSFIHS